MTALQKFAQSEEFVDAVVSSTQAGFDGSGYSVEVFEDGTSRVLWDNQIGNRYESPGMIVRIPQLSAEEAEEGDLREVAEFYRDELAAQMLDSASA